MKILIVILLLLITGFVSAQASSKSLVKIATVNTMRFEGDRDGIRKLVIYSNKASEVGFPASSSAAEEISIVEKEIRLLECQNLPTEAKTIQLKALKTKVIELQDSSRAAYKKRYSILVEPVINEIRAKLKEYASKNGYQVVVDTNTLNESPVILVGENITDITEDFIKFFNKSNSEVK